jgi:hypothetical protein
MKAPHGDSIGTVHFSAVYPAGTTPGLFGGRGCSAASALFGH